MSLAAIKRAVSAERRNRDAANARTLHWHGEQLTITKLAADDGLKLLALSEGMAKADGVPTDPAELRRFFEFVAAATVLDDDGSRAFETDEGRALLASMTLDALTDLGTAALEWSGLRAPEESKKN